MRRILLLCVMLLALQSRAQKRVDTVIDMGNYRSWFCKELKEPLFVGYVLYRGGGDCSRKGFRFRDAQPWSAGHKDYAKTGYDEGHLANAEDFAGDCPADERTFRFWNCLPQTPNLNRGIWKKWEEQIRKESQTDSLWVVCGGGFQKPKWIGRNVAVPDVCWKCVQRCSDGVVVHALLFTNTAHAEVRECTVADIEAAVGYPIQLWTR
jgi:DNA/RNA endonuclease G (NUC1)